MKDDKKIEFCKRHIEDLSEKLAEIYTITDTKDGEKNINVAEEIDKLEFVEDIYSAIEEAGLPQGNTYEEYNRYLHNVRESLKRYRKIKEEIEKNNMEEIENINLLLKVFKIRLESLD